MKWLGRKQSDNFEDRGSGGGGGRMVAGGGIVTVIIIVIGLLTGKNPAQLLDAVQGGVAQTEQSEPVNDDPVTKERKGFIRVVLKETETVWDSIFRAEGSNYQQPTLISFSGQVQSACGGASSASGPFYCPADNQVYIDVSFYDELKDRFNASGDFAMAYVIAHEVGHHVQNLLGTSSKVQQMRQQLSEEEYNKLSVKLELQADFYAGLWAHHTQRNQNILEEGDIEEALNAANAIGDDRLQKQATGTITPDAFTHGTSAQRMKWFKKGYDTGDINQGDTFSAGDL